MNGGDSGALTVGDVVSARSDLCVGEGVVVPAGRCGVVQAVADPQGGVAVRFPLVVGGHRRLVTLIMPRASLWLTCRSDDVLRGPTPAATGREGEWSVLQKDELCSLGARLTTAARVPPPHVFQGEVVVAGIYGRIGSCTEEKNGRVTFSVNVTLPDADSYQGYRFTNLELTREQFELVDPALADGIQRMDAGARARAEKKVRELETGLPQAFEAVRVRALLRDPGTYDPWKVNERPPRRGDLGCVVEILQAPNQPPRCVVECVRRDGTTAWVAEFTADELERA